MDLRYATNPDQIPTFTSAATATFLAGTAGTFNLTASGFPASI